METEERKAQLLAGAEVDREEEVKRMRRVQLLLQIVENELALAVRHNARTAAARKQRIDDAVRDGGTTEEQEEWELKYHRRRTPFSRFHTNRLLESATVLKEKVDILIEVADDMTINDEVRQVYESSES